MNIPEDLKYSETHEWVRLEDGKARVGITEHAQAELTDVVYVEPPKVGAKVQAKAPAAVVESVKAAGDIYSPVTGTVVAVNEALENNPALVNTDPHGEGWIFLVALDHPEELVQLKSAAEYRAMIGE